MTQPVATILLWLFVINLGVAFGAGVYSAADLSEDVRAGLAQWLLLNNGRHILTLAAWLAALKALSLPAR